MDCGIYGWGYASLPMENMSPLGHPVYGIGIGTNTTSDARSFLPRDPLSVGEPWVNCRPQPLGVPAYTHNLQSNPEVPASLRPSIPAAHIHEGARALHLENVIADIHDEGSDSSVVHSPDPIFWTEFSSSFTQMPQNSTEVFGLPYGISNDSITYVDYSDVDTAHDEGGSIDIPSDQGNQYSQSDATSNTSESSVPSGVSCSPAIAPYREQRTSQDHHQQLQKTGKRKEHAASSSRSGRRPTGRRGLGNGPYSCEVCGKPYTQRQGVGRHRRETHDARSCNHCGTFRWGRPYVFKKHILERHPHIDPDAALEEAMGAGRVPPSVTHDVPPTPEYGRRTRAEFQPHLLTPLVHQVARLLPIPISPPAMSDSDSLVNHDQGPESTELIINYEKKRKRYVNETGRIQMPNSCAATGSACSSSGERVQLAKHSDMFSHTGQILVVLSGFGTNSKADVLLPTLIFPSPHISSHVTTPVSISTARFERTHPSPHSRRRATNGP